MRKFTLRTSIPRIMIVRLGRWCCSWKLIPVESDGVFLINLFANGEKSRNRLEMNVISRVCLHILDVETQLERRARPIFHQSIPTLSLTATPLRTLNASANQHPAANLNGRRAGTVETTYMTFTVTKQSGRSVGGAVPESSWLQQMASLTLPQLRSLHQRLPVFRQVCHRLTEQVTLMILLSQPRI